MYEPSYWEMDSVFNNVDVCIVGSGIVGLNAAIHLKTCAPASKVVIVERGFLPYGASTRNAGFACFGSITELIDDLKKESEEEVIKRLELRYKGLQKLREIIGDKVLEYEEYGGYEVFTEEDEAVFEKCTREMSRFNNWMENISGIKTTYTIADDQIGRFGMKNVKHLIINKGEGQLNTGKMMHALVSIACQKKVHIINGLSVKEVASTGKQVTLTCDDGFKFQAKRLLLANNGFVNKLIPGIAVNPARAQVLITKPIENLRIKGSFHYDKGYYYFRNVGDRVLFGGGRNLDIEGETTTSFGITQKIQDKLDELLRNMILPEQSFEVEMRWSGIMGTGPSKSTILKQVDGNIYCAVRMGGMGVAIGSVIGQQGADMILQSL